MYETVPFVERFFFVHRNYFCEQKILREGAHSREYNILIFGTRQNANRLANRIVGMLKENENKLASFEIMDISKLKIKLYSINLLMNIFYQTMDLEINWDSILRILNLVKCR